MKPSMRRPILLAVVLLHGLLLWLLSAGFRTREDAPAELPRFVSLWLPPLGIVPPPPPEPEPRERVRTRSVPPAPAPVPEPAPVIAAPAATAPPPESPPPPSPTAPAPPVDWPRESKLAARRMVDAEIAAAAAAKRNPMNQQPAKLAGTCKPPERSMEWKGQEDRRAGFTGGIPYVKLNDRCVLVAIFPMCVLGKLPQGNGHLLDDMQDAERSRSSVPDPNTCD